MNDSMTKSLFMATRDKAAEVARRKEQLEKEREAKLEARLKEQAEKLKRTHDQKNAELQKKLREKTARELQRSQAVLERRMAHLNQEKVRRAEILQKAHTATSRTAQSSPKRVYAFGSSTPRELSYLERLSKDQKQYDRRLAPPSTNSSRNSPSGTPPRQLGPKSPNSSMTTSLYVPSKISSSPQKTPLPRRSVVTTPKLLNKPSAMTQSLYVPRKEVARTNPATRSKPSTPIAPTKPVPSKRTSLAPTTPKSSPMAAKSTPQRKPPLPARSGTSASRTTSKPLATPAKEESKSVPKPIARPQPVAVAPSPTPEPVEVAVPSDVPVVNTSEKSEAIVDDAVVAPAVESEPTNEHLDDTTTQLDDTHATVDLEVPSLAVQLEDEKCDLDIQDDSASAEQKVDDVEKVVSETSDDGAHDEQPESPLPVSSAEFLAADHGVASSDLTVESEAAAPVPVVLPGVALFSAEEPVAPFTIVHEEVLFDICSNADSGPLSSVHEIPLEPAAALESSPFLDLSELDASLDVASDASPPKIIKTTTPVFDLPDEPQPVSASGGVIPEAVINLQTVDEDSQPVEKVDTLLEEKCDDAAANAEVSMIEKLNLNSDLKPHEHDHDDGPLANGLDTARNASPDGAHFSSSSSTKSDIENRDAAAAASLIDDRRARLNEIMKRARKGMNSSPPLNTSGAADMNTSVNGASALPSAVQLAREVLTKVRKEGGADNQTGSETDLAPSPAPENEDESSLPAFPSGTSNGARLSLAEELTVAKQQLQKSDNSEDEAYNLNGKTTPPEDPSHVQPEVV